MLRDTSGVRVLSDAAPQVPGWSCAQCGTPWRITALTLWPWPWLDQLAGDVVTRSVLREVATLAEQADTLTEGRLRAGCSAASRDLTRSAATAPPGSRLSTGRTMEVPVPRWFPRSALAALESAGTGTAR